MNSKNEGYNLGTKLNIHRITHAHTFPLSIAFFKTLKIKGLKKKKNINLYIYEAIKIRK